ncbi:MAG: 50S ribosomal protein L32e [Candidatus Heimdallarchaeota archaeon LC_3]|nr:MAG: 50S ribosomal protein L32e [Candidatus Heimdallarchaeota archaeon LC_3]
MSTNDNNIRRLARVRRNKQRKNPTFKSTNSWRYKRVNSRWKRPRGIDNKMAEAKKGVPATVNIGYRTPRALRGLHVDGKNNVREEYLVHNMSDLELVLPHKHVVRIASTVGRRKKEEILQQARSWGLKIINPPIITEDIGLDETDEDLSLDRDLSELDLNLEDIEDTETETDVTEKEDLSLDLSDDLDMPSEEEETEDGEELLADEFKDEKSAPKSKPKTIKKKK